MKKGILTSLLDESYGLIKSLDIGLAMSFARSVWKLRTLNNKVIFMGNGASNTIATHAALDYMNQTGVKTLSVNDASIITAFSNDFGYEQVFERFVKINYEPGDILVCISSSGNSENVVRAAKYVSDQQGLVIALTGFEKDNKLGKIVPTNLWVNSKRYNVVESIHNLWLAMICDVLTAWMQGQAGVHGVNA